jgi:pimeloyl-ACP methyl ester carboxylesterase
MNGSGELARELGAITCRVLHFGVPPGELRQAGEAGDWPGWSARLAAAGERYRMAAEAAGETRWVSAAELGRRAAACFHYAQLRLAPGPDRERLAAACRRAYARAAGLLHPPARAVAVPWLDGFLAGYLRQARPGAPWVVLINGLDSAKEVELDRFAEGFLARGSSVCYFDTPGLGESPGPLSLERFDAALSALLDHLAREEGSCAGPIGLFGVSFGGHLACRAAAREPRVAACVCLGGFHDARPLDRLPASARERLHQACGLGGGEELDLSAFTLASLPGLGGRPLLVLHGTADHLVDAGQVEALAAWGGPGAEVRLLAGAEHACTDRFGELLPEVWDWMTARLAESAGGVGAPQELPQ